MLEAQLAEAQRDRDRAALTAAQQLEARFQATYLSEQATEIGRLRAEVLELERERDEWRSKAKARAPAHPHPPSAAQAVGTARS